MTLVRARLLAYVATVLFGSGMARTQTLGGYTLVDALVSAVHPNGCSDENVIGYPDLKTWVNMDAGSVMTGLFGSAWSDDVGPDLLLETSFHADNYMVRLALQGGGYSAFHSVVTTDWTQITGVEWTYDFADCSSGIQLSQRLIVPLDLVDDFGVLPTESVEGIEITFLTTNGAPDLAGVYIIGAAPCDSILDLGADTTLCAGATLTLDATLAGGAFTWQDGSTSNTYSVSGPGVYSVEVITPCDTLVDSIAVAYQDLSVDLGADTVLCSGEEFWLDATTPNAQYVWQDASTGSDLLVSTTGTYHVTVSTSCGDVSDTILVEFVTLPLLDLGADTTLCDGEVLQLSAEVPGGVYTWQDGTTDGIHTVAGPGLYSVEVQTPCGLVTDSITINYAPAPPLNLGNDTTLCEGGTLLLDATFMNGTYRWQDNSTQPFFEVSAGGTYQVWLEVNGCVVTDPIVIEGLPLPTTDLGPDRSVCESDVIVLDATSTTVQRYLWSSGSTASTFSVAGPGTYSVTVSNSCGVFMDTVLVAVDPLSGFDLGDDIVLCDGDQIILDARLAGASYEWHDGSSLPTFAVASAGTYSVEVIFGICTATDALSVVVEDCIVTLRMPNVFTPNGDGLNDQFFPVEMRSIRTATLSIYNRWGQVVHTGTLLPRAGWTGRDVPDGTYYWEVMYTDKFGSSDVQKGVVTLLR